MYKYKNVSDSDQTIITQGDIQPRRVPAGQFVESDVEIENPNFEFVEEFEKQTGAVDATQVPQPNAVTDATPVSSPTQEEQL